MTQFTRRGLVLGAVALAACDTSQGSTGAEVIDRRVENALSYMYATYPETLQLRDKAIGKLVMPMIGQAGFIVGGSYGEGALQIDGVTVEYYSATQGSIGFQIGAQQFAYVIFFLTPTALRRFRTSPGWTGGAAAELTGGQNGAGLAANTLTQNSSVAFLFARQGLMAGATIQGTKYTRILR
ncbi:twin-arginine translocation pathway signal [Meridianimarinicoccus roseus]|uniref:Twin-arginine translocation pathway signal n=1 Tax=Meridianimarinicoccus roseus TaxID=2072018 RepID=A0A2V2LRH5_9RHOB|nr:lipid-binding SYLF domain-containing protein [Meridianimarinicoccus roseus]PWR04083.1 twin-arginine translocation pathway signal [Meridianimarinicoccus roseus]